MAVAKVTAHASAPTTVMSTWGLRCGSSSAPSVVTPSRWMPRAANCTAMIQSRASRPNQELFCGNCCWPAMLSTATACPAAVGGWPVARRRAAAAPAETKRCTGSVRWHLPPQRSPRNSHRPSRPPRRAPSTVDQHDLVSLDLPDCFRGRVRSLCHPLCHRPPAWSVAQHPKHPGHAKLWEPQSAEGPVAGPPPQTMALHSMQKAVRVSRGAGRPARTGGPARGRRPTGRPG